MSLSATVETSTKGRASTSGRSAAQHGQHAPQPSPHSTTPSPLDAERIIDDAFITPKVLDRRAFDELSSILKQLVRDASAKGQALQATASEVRALGDSLREATRQLQTRLEAALKVAPALDQRTAKAEQLIQLAVDRAKLTEHIEASLSQIIDARLAEVGRKLSAMTAEHEARLHAAGERALEEISTHRARAESEAQQACDQINHARTRLTTDVEGFQQIVRAQVDAATERLSEPIRHADRRSVELSTRLDAEIESAEDRLRAAREHADIKLAALIDTSTRHAEAVTRRASEETGTIDLRLRDLVDQAAARITALRSQSERMDEDGQARLRETMAAITAHLGAFESQAAAIEARSQAAVAQVTDSGNTAADAVMKAGAHIAGQLADLGTAAAQGVDRAKAQLGGQIEQISELQRQLAAATEQLAALRGEADGSGRALAEAIRAAGASVDLLQRITGANNPE